MSEIVNKIKYAMSLRTPQEEALSYLDAISSHCDYKKDSKDVIEAAASEYCEKQRKVKAGFEFPSFCYAMATGIGKTRLMGASIYYLYKTKGYKHFFILAPGNTIYEKLRKESNPNHPKYIFKGLEAEMERPKVYDGENYDTYPIKYDQMTLIVEKTSDIQLFIFNIGKIFNSKADTQFNFHKFKETLGASFADVLAQFDDLVICMDEAHRYYAPASMKAINYLKPVFGLEFTATPKTTSNVIYAYDLARGAVEGYLKIPVVMGRSNMAGYNQDDIEEMKIRDGLTLHEHRKAVLREYCSENDLDYVKPIVLVACKDTDHAKKIRALIDSDDFQGGKYKGKVIEIHSKQTGEESEENIRLLLSIESASNPVEIVLHVYKLKEGWDVNNLFTIIPLNAAKSDILAMQTIGRGLRLPFGEQTGNEDLDSLDIVAHDHYRELVDEIKSSDIFRYLSAATPDFIHASTSLILNFHSLPILAAGISLRSIQSRTVSRLTPKYSIISFIEYQRSRLLSIVKPSVFTKIQYYNIYYTTFFEISQGLIGVYSGFSRKNHKSHGRKKPSFEKSREGFETISFRLYAANDKTASLALRCGY